VIAGHEPIARANAILGGDRAPALGIGTESNGNVPRVPPTFTSERRFAS
jgi:hypothetical protein